MPYQIILHQKNLEGLSWSPIDHIRTIDAATICGCYCLCVNVAFVISMSLSLSVILVL